MSEAWISISPGISGMRMFECGGKTVEECAWYKHRWHFWYVADYVFALPTVAFFMSGIGVFVVAHVVSGLFLRQRKAGPGVLVKKVLAGSRYLAYRGFHVRRFKWNSAPVGVLLLGAAGVVFFFCMDLIPQPYYWASKKFGNSPPLATRSGWLALGCMPFLFATASKTNWITLVTGVSYERLQVFHRWIAYAFFILALMHTFPFIIYHIHWHDMEHHFSSSLLFYWTGIVALVFQAWLTFMSHSVLRNRGYEFFKATHFFAAVVFMITFFWHCDQTLTSWDYFVVTAAIYVPCYIYPWLRTAFEYKLIQRAWVAVEDNGFIRVTIPATFHWTPGQHCFLRFTSFGFLSTLTAHPFTICSSPAKILAESNELVFYIRRQGGFTGKLYQHAFTKPDGDIPVLVDGPYGGASWLRLRNADRLLVIAGGSGAGWALPFIEHFLGSVANSIDEAVPRTSYSAPTSLRVVLATRDTKSCLWFEQTLQTILAQYPTAILSSVQIEVHLTGEAANQAKILPKTVQPSTHSVPSEASNDIIVGTEKEGETFVSGKEHTGRPQLPLIVQEEAEKAADADETLNVYICGPKTMQNDVRNAVAAENLKIITGARSGGVYLHTEHFSWA